MICDPCPTTVRPALPALGRGRGDWMRLQHTVRRRIAILPAAERRLLHFRFEAGLSYRQIAALDGDTPSAVHRHTRHLIARLSDALLAPLADHPEALEARQWQIAIRALLAGHSIRRICIEMSTDRIHVAAACTAAETWCLTEARRLGTEDRRQKPGGANTDS